MITNSYSEIPLNIRKEISKKIRARAESNYLPIDYYTDHKQYGVWFHFSGRNLGKSWVLANDCILRWLKNGSEFLYTVRTVDKAKNVTKGFWGKELQDTGLIIQARTSTGEIYLAVNPNIYDFGIEIETKTKNLQTGETDVETTYKPKFFKIGQIKALGDIRSSGDYSRTNRIILEEALAETYSAYRYDEYNSLESVMETVRPLKEYGNVQLIALGNLVSFSNPYFSKFGLTPHDVGMNKRYRIKKVLGYSRKNVLFDFRTCNGYVERMLERYSATSEEELTDYERYAIYGELIKSEKENIVKSYKGVPFWAFAIQMGQLVLYKDKETYYITETKRKDSKKDNNVYRDYENLYLKGKFSDIDVLSVRSYAFSRSQLTWLIYLYSNKHIKFVGYGAYSLFKELIKDR